MDNYSSTQKQLDKVEAQINKELAENHYAKVTHKPTIVSALGAIPKDNGDIRLIHDCSRPQGKAVNDYAEKISCKYQTIQSAIKHLTPGCYLAKVDLQSAYRSVGLHPSQFEFTGLKWTFKGDPNPTWLIDKRLPFGARKSPGIFHRLTQAVRRMMSRRGYTVIAYQDDFLIIAATKDQCMEAFYTLLRLLRTLGFSIAWHKTVSPTQSLTFLGVCIDTTLFCLRLPQEKVTKLLALLASFQSRRRASCRQLQQLAGKLSWATCAVPGGRIYLQRVFDVLRQLKHPSHKTLLTEEFRSDIAWWQTSLLTSTVLSLAKVPRKQVLIFTDASDHGAGAFCQDDWLYINWDRDLPQWKHASINVRETVAVLAAFYRWAPFWENCDVIIYTDNITTRATLNSLLSKHELLRHHLRLVFYLSQTLNFELHCVHVPGVCHIEADAASRLHSPGHFMYWFSLISGGQPFSLTSLLDLFPQHVSPITMDHFISQVNSLVPSYRS